MTAGLIQTEDRLSSVLKYVIMMIEDRRSDPAMFYTVLFAYRTHSTNLYEAHFRSYHVSVRAEETTR